MGSRTNSSDQRVYSGSVLTFLSNLESSIVLTFIFTELFAIDSYEVLTGFIHPSPLRIIPSIIAFFLSFFIQSMLSSIYQQLIDIIHFCVTHIGVIG